MKFMTLALLPLILLSAQANAGSYTCTETSPKGAVYKEVVVQELADLSDKVSWGEEYDNVTLVKVTLNNVKNGKRTTLLSFKTTQLSADVKMIVSAKQKHGFILSRYMDSEDDDGMTLTYSNGQSKHFDMKCTSPY